MWGIGLQMGCTAAEAVNHNMERWGVGWGGGWGGGGGGGGDLDTMKWNGGVEWGV